MSRRRTWLSGAIVASVLCVATSPVAGGPSAGCPSEVRDALESWGQDGVHRAAAAIRSEETGIGKPESVFDFTCLSNLFKTPDLYEFADPGAIVDVILQGIEDFVCEAGDHLYRKHVDRPIQELVFWDELPHVPGLEVGTTWRDKVVPPEINIRPLEDIEASTESFRDTRWFRHAIGGSQ